MSKIQEIYQGWKNLIFRNEQVEDSALNRLNKCNECPHRSNYPDNVSITSTCKLCGCVLKAKVRSTNSTCPDKRW